MRIWLLTALLLVPALAVAQDVAVEEADPRRFAGERVVEVEFQGLDGALREEFTYLVEQKVGAPYDPSAVRRTLELLFRLGRFEQVEARAEARPTSIPLMPWVTLPRSTL